MVLYIIFTADASFFFAIYCIKMRGAVNEGVKGMVLADADVFGGIVNSTPLADDNIAGFHGFATEFLDSQTFGMGLTTVLGT